MHVSTRALSLRAAEDPPPERPATGTGDVTSSPDAQSDPAVDLTAFRRGDPAVYETVFRHYYVALCTFASRLTVSRDDAEEVVQTVFSALWQRHGQVHITTTLRAYLYTAVRNEALNSIKHRRVVHRAHEALAANDSCTSGTRPQAPDLILERDEVTARIRAAMGDLPQRSREVLTLRWEHGMSYDEIGTVLGIRPNSAKMQQSRALAMLRQRLADLLPPGSGGE